MNKYVFVAVSVALAAFIYNKYLTGTATAATA